MSKEKPKRTPDSIIARRGKTGSGKLVTRTPSEEELREAEAAIKKQRERDKSKDS